MSLRAVCWFIGWMLVTAITVLCLLPTNVLIQTPDFLSDKGLHLLANAGLALWFAGLMPRDHWWRLFVGLLALGVAIELAQASMGLGRHAEWLDLAANGAGTLLGLILARLGLERWLSWISGLLGVQAAR